MSTTKQELENLRLARKAAREEEEARQKREAEQAIENARKDAFRKKAAMFAQKNTPTVEEVVQKVKQEEQKRKFNRKLNKFLKAAPNENPLMVEYSLKNGISVPTSKSTDKSDDSDWQLIEQEGGLPPYYWNRRTNVSTYDNPFKPSDGSTIPHPPPPPPPRQLHGINEVKDIAWMRVTPEDGSIPYFWNKYTDESKYDAPDEEYVDYDGTLMPVESNEPYTPESGEAHELESNLASHGEDIIPEGDVAPEELGVTWEEILNPDTGEVYYVRYQDDGELLTRSDRPDGSVYIIVSSYTDENGVYHERETWEEVFAEEFDGEGNDVNSVLYKSLSTAEIVGERPIGQVIIVEDSIVG